MKLKTVSLAMLVFLSLVLGRAGSAQESQPLEREWLRQMHAKGWQKVQEGVLQRDTGKGRFETFGYGAEGLQWLIQDYEQQVQYFEAKYKASPNAELLDLIEPLKDKVESLNVELLTAPPAESFDGEALTSCSIMLDPPVAFAQPDTSVQGVTATASARFNNDCGYTGYTTAYAYAHAIDGTLETTVTQIDPKDGASIESYAYASAPGSTGCESRAEATVEVPQLSYFTSSSESNYSCPDKVWITGPAMVTTDYYGATCADVTWTANTASGRTDYAFDWYIDTDPPVQGTGSTFTKTYCNTSQTVTVKVVARDTAGASYTSPPFTTIIKHIEAVIASFSGPTSVTTDNYINSGCADVTWTASATGGHPPYTFTWYFDTDAPVQGNPFTKRICAINKSVTLKMVASDSDGHTATNTSTITIQHIGPVVASASGPTSVTTDYYINAGCADVTWTANATGGHAGGYTYSWYIGTDPTVQGTGSTFTKSYCKTSQSVAVKVIASDSDGHTDDAQLTTTINYKAIIRATISGPTSVSSTTSCTTVTWTVGASGTGHSGFSYKWFIGTTQQTSTSTTFSKQFCSSGGTSQSVTVKATASASDGHSDTDTHTTSISFPPPPPPPSPTASISGPTSVQLTSSTECKSITWTASATGGTPGYTYSWYIGTSTTVQGTATTLTKTYCGPQTINVKVVVRDAAAQTDDATFTTTISVAALAATISGESEAYLANATSCYDLTWSANVSGGTPAYTYSWTIGTSTTVLSTTSTLTRRVCSPQTLNVKLTVRDSASHTANATFTTTVYQDSTCIALCQ